MRFNLPFGWMAAALFGALLLLLGLGTAHAQTISNIAAARWTSEGRTLEVQSNRVAFEVVRQGAQIETFSLDRAAGRPVAWRTPLCGAAPTALPDVTVHSAAAISLSPSAAFRVGQTLYFSITAPEANKDPAAIDFLRVTLESGSDREELTVYESTIASGVFIGGIATTGGPAVPGDCRLSVSEGEPVRVAGFLASGAEPLALARIAFRAPVSNFVFDSVTGQPVSGARVSLVNAATGQPAQVFALDGVTPWPSVVTSGETVTDAAGNTAALLPGEYLFPIVAPGSYRLIVEPPAPYVAPSAVPAAALAALARPAGGSFAIVDASLGRSFVVSGAEPLRADIPLDRQSDTAVLLSKTASRARALPGDTVFFTVTLRNPDTTLFKRGVVLTDTPPAALRLQPGSIRVDGQPAGELASIAPDGRRFVITLPALAPAAQARVTYAMTVRADAAAGEAVNEAEVVDARGARTIAREAIRIERDVIAGRMTIVGRVTAGACEAADRPGVPGVRVMLEDGSFAITDADGRYHFEGVSPGTHVVQAQPQTLPTGGRFVDCARSTRVAGAAASRFAIGQGGSLVVADFAAVIPDWQPPAIRGAGDGEQAPAAYDAAARRASGADVDWLEMGSGPAAILFPEADHNPRVPAIRVAIRHQPEQNIELSVNGKAVDPLSFDGVKTSADGTFAVSVWRGVALPAARTRLRAIVRAADGAVAAELDRDVFYTGAPWRAQIVPERSRLVADGSGRPVVAVRLTDRQGRPVRSGVSGNVLINEPFESAAAIDRRQSGALTGQVSAAPGWTVAGDDGMALVELAPTMVSGPLHLHFQFADGDLVREQVLDAWIVPGDQDWTLIGLAEGSAGARSIADAMEPGANFASAPGNDARVAFYAKGRVLGRALLTVAFDSAKGATDQRLLGTIDPNAYYTVFADGSARRFDAPSRDKLYVRVEAATFYALYGDFVAAFDQTLLGRYVRTTTGVKAEGLFGQVHVQGFAAETTGSHRRDEMQGNGLTGPYRLSSRAILANSERVVIEVRDRLRSELILSRRELVRFVDYDIDLLSGTVRFAEPVLSRDYDLNPRFIVIDYETDALNGTGRWNAGARTTWTSAGEALRIGATGFTDAGDGARTTVGAVDVRARIGAATEVRAELAASERDGEQSAAWLVEAEHRTGSLDVLAYVRSLDAGYGVGQQNGAEVGRRKAGVDARYALTQNLAVVASAWHDESLVDDSRRRAARVLATYRAADADIRFGVAHLSDTYADGTRGATTALEGGLTKRFLDNRLEIDGTATIALGAAESVDLANRYRLGARYAVTSDVQLIGTYEIAQGEELTARTLRGGLEMGLWTGGRLVSTIGTQDLAEIGGSTFAAFGLSQSLAVSRNITLDATLDINRTLDRPDAAHVLNPLHPAASGGFLSQDGALFENFAAVTVGAGWRHDRWAATGRAELRDGEFATRAGVTAGLLRQLGEGRVVGAGVTWTRADADEGAETEILDAAVSLAVRPADSAFAYLGKLEYRSDRVADAVQGAVGPAGQVAFNVTGDAISRRLVASLSANWLPLGSAEGGLTELAEIGVFLGGRYNFDQVADFSFEGSSLLGGLDARIALSPKIEVGGSASVRGHLTDRTTSFAVGPHVGFVPVPDVLLMVGYNVAGFRDRDFAAARHTDKGFFASARMKLDADSFGFLGLGRR